MAEMILSRQRAVIAALASASCRSPRAPALPPPPRSEEVQKLRARALYEQGLKTPRRPSDLAGPASLKEAVATRPRATRNDSQRARRPATSSCISRSTPEAEFKKAVELDPGFGEAVHNLGLSFAEQGRYEDAIAQYRKAISLPIYPTPEVGYYNLGTGLCADQQAPGGGGSPADGDPARSQARGRLLPARGGPGDHGEAEGGQGSVADGAGSGPRLALGAGRDGSAEDPGRRWASGRRETASIFDEWEQALGLLQIESLDPTAWFHGKRCLHQSIGVLLCLCVRGIGQELPRRRIDRVRWAGP